MEDIYVRINKETRQVFLSKSVIGNDGENLQEKFIFLFNDEFVNGTARVEIIKPNKEKSYIMVDKVGETYEMPVKSIMTKVGKIDMQLVITEGTDDEEIPIFKSNTFWVICNESINAETITEDEYPDFIDRAETKLNAIDEAIEDTQEAIDEANNLDLDVTKIDKTATVTLTKKDTTTKSVTLSDGTSLQFMWSGTSLGIKTDNDIDYTYVDLQGVQGPIGPKGEAFTIKKTYSSVAEMNADFNNMQLGDYVMIASTVEVEDNAKLYTKGESQWIFISDFSGSQGIRGETGLTPNIQIGTVVSGSTPSVTRTGTNEEPILNFVLEKGDKGDTGNTGPTGNGISTIIKTGTSGLVDTYTITYTNGTTSTFTVTNGEITLEVFNRLKNRVNDLENNEVIKTETGTNVTINDAHEMNVVEIKLSKESTQNETPSPTNPVEINTIKGYKNLLNLSGFSTQTISGITLTKNSNNSISINGTSTSAITLDIPITDIELTTGKTYRIYQNNTFTGSNYAVSLRDSATNIVDTSCSLDSATSSKTFTVSSNKIAKYFRIYIVTGKTINTTIYPMITESNAIFPYAIYGNDWMYITITNGTNTKNITIPLGDNEIVGIDDYRDEIIIDINGHCWLNKKIAKIVLNGTEQWQDRPNYNYADRFVLDNIFPNYSNSYILSNYFEKRTNETTDSYPNIGRNNKLCIINFNAKSTTTLSNFKTWLSTHNTTVYYVVETPALIDLNYDVDVRLFNGNNTITNNETANMVIKYVTDIENVLETKQNTLISGTNIKTINNQSLLGSGNISVGGGSGGTSDYPDLENKPQINNVTLSGNKSLSDLGIQPAGSYYTKPETGIPSTDLSSAVQTSLGKADTAIQDISGKLDTSKVKSAYSTTSGDVYDVTYINSTLGDIESLLGNI